MKFFQKAREKLTGKTDLERKQEKEALKQIRKEVDGEKMKTRRKEAVKFATEAVKEEYKKRLEKLKQQRSSFNTGFVSPLQKSRLSEFLSPTQVRGIKQKRFNVITGAWE